MDERHRGSMAGAEAEAEAGGADEDVLCESLTLSLEEIVASLSSLELALHGTQRLAGGEDGFPVLRRGGLLAAFPTRGSRDGKEDGWCVLQRPTLWIDGETCSENAGAATMSTQSKVNGKDGDSRGGEMVVVVVAVLNGRTAPQSSTAIAHSSR